MTDALFSVAGQVVLVSGGTRGIGKAIAHGFSERGAEVIITGRKQEDADRAAEEISVGEIPVTGLACDVSQSARIESCTEEIIKRFGHVDTLLNVAGVNRRKPAEQVDEDDYAYILDINLKGAFQMAQSVGRNMLQRGRGSIINIDSLNTYAPLKGVVPYAMSKGGMQMMTRGLATEWGPKGVRVNGLAPGFILTDLTRKMWSQPIMQDWNLNNTPLKRLGEVHDLVGTAIFLASTGSAFMTGQTLYVDGGFSAGINWPIDFNNQ